MAILKVFAVYDSKLAAFYPPFMCPHEQIAKRAFMASAHDKESQLSAHPEDFTLFELARWNDETGQYENQQHPINHGAAALYRVRKLNGQGTSQPLSDAASVQPSPESGDSA